MVENLKNQSRITILIAISIILAVLVVLTFWTTSTALEFSVSVLRQPDLFITNISASNPNPSFGETITISVEIKNEGSTSSAGFMVDLFDNPVVPLTPVPGTRGDLGTLRVSTLGMGESKVIEFTGISWPYQTGEVHDIWGGIDTDDEVNESDESNNTFGPAGILIKPFLVDLTILSITPSEFNPSIGDTVTVDVVVKNQGIGGAGSFDLDLFDSPVNTTPSIGDTGSLYSIVSGLAAGAQTTVSFQMIWQGAGDRYLFGVIDTKQLIQESSENNNIFGPSNIFIGKPEVEILSINPLEPNVVKGGSLSVDVTIKNTGLNHIPQNTYFSVDLFDQFSTTAPSVGDATPNSILIPKLDIGEITIVRFNLTNLQATGTHYLFAIADNNQRVNESDENNNVFGPVEVKVYDDKLGVINSWDSGSNNWSFDASKVTRGDYNGDGRDDIAFMYGYKTQRDVRVLVAKGKSDGTFAAPAPWWQAGAGNWDWNGSKLVSGDFNGDGKDDLSVLYGYKTQRDVKAFVLRSTGSSFRSPSVWWQAGAGNWDWNGSKLDVGDFNGDGKDDLVILYGYKTQRDVKAFVLRSTGNSFRSPAVWWQAGAGNWDWNGSKLSVGDYNGDGKDDLSILYGYKIQRDVRAFVLRSTGNSFRSPSAWWQAGAGNWDWKGSKFLSGDYNGDGDEDIAIFYGYGSSKVAVFVFLSNGSSRFASQGAWYASASGAWDWNRTKILSGDFDGNGIDNFAGVYKLENARIRLFMIR